MRSLDENRWRTLESHTQLLLLLLVLHWAVLLSVEVKMTLASNSPWF